MKQHAAYMWFVVPAIGAVLSLGGLVWQTRASAEAVKNMVPQSEFQLVVKQLDRLEDKVDRITQLIEEGKP